MPISHLHIGADTGGTFTDLVAWDGRSLRTAKVPSTPPEFQRGVVAAIEAVLRPGETADVIHGSTVATNALLERKGSPIAFITTEGFRDLLLIGRQNRPVLYDLEPRRALPIVDEDHVFTLAERIGADGRIVTALNPVDVDTVIARIRSLDLNHVAVCLLFSFVNPQHEKIVGEQLRRAGLTVTLSCELLAEFREYERASATVINSALRPNVEHYLNDLAGAVPSAVQSLRIMHSGGGTLSTEDAGRFAARLLLSGPAGGLLGASHLANLEGFKEAITYDMGGTSTDVAAIVDGNPPWTTGTTIDGLPVPLAMFDIHTIGAGGGSIAALDLGGALCVGPRSAGANPGPACYGRGGAMPTVTDANLILGRLLPDRFLGGRMALSMERAEAALEPLARQMGKSLIETALGIIRIADSNMTAAIRHVTAGRGHDPRAFILISFGGAGGLHAASLADSLDIRRVFVPPHAGLLSALGMIVAPPLVDVSKTIVHLRLSLDEALLTAEYAELERQSGETLPPEVTEQVERFADCRFRGQSYELTVQVESMSFAAIEQQFRADYAKMYGQCPQRRDIEIVTLRLRRRGRSASFSLPAIEPHETKSSTAAVTLSDAECVTLEVIDRPTLAAREKIVGPMMLAEPDSTLLIPPGWTARLTTTGGILMQREDCTRLRGL